MFSWLKKHKPEPEPTPEPDPLYMAALELAYVEFPALFTDPQHPDVRIYMVEGILKHRAIIHQRSTGEWRAELVEANDGTLLRTRYEAYRPKKDAS